MKKLLSTLLIVFLIVSMFCVTPVLAAEDTTGEDETTAENIIDGINIKIAKNDNIMKIAGKIIGAIQFISVIAAIILVAVFGFQFIMGSAEQKKDYKDKFIPLIVGVVVVFSVTTIAKILFTTLGV